MEAPQQPESKEVSGEEEEEEGGRERGEGGGILYSRTSLTTAHGDDGMGDSSAWLGDSPLIKITSPKCVWLSHDVSASVTTVTPETAQWGYHAISTQKRDYSYVSRVIKQHTFLKVCI